MSESAAQRYARFLAEFPETRLQVPDRHIASYLGITPETLSRVRRRAAQASGAPGERGRRS